MAAGCERGVSLVGALAVGTVTSALALTVYFTVSAITTADATFAVLRHQTEFEREFAWAWCDHRFFVFTAGFASNASRAVHVERVLAAIDEGKDRFDELRSSYASQKRRSATLRRANRGFRALSRSFDDYVVFQHWALETAIEFCPESGCDFDEYSSTFVATFREEARAAQDALTEKSLRFAADIADVSTSASSVTLYIALVVEVLLLALLAALAGLVYKVKDSARRLEAQEKLARQQAHEMRNKYAPAMAVMEQFDHACRAHPLRVDDILALRDDMAMALVALGEVEAQHQARLDIYKIMRGNYVLHLETFEVLALLRDRVQVEHAVALARTRAGRVTAEAAVDYLVRVADDFVDCEEIHICCDQYILNHVVSNLLANSRKFTNQGRVIVTFCGPTENGLLTFAVEDTGTGMPEDLVPRLFRTEVATADNRGTGASLLFLASRERAPRHIAAQASACPAAPSSAKPPAATFDSTSRDSRTRWAATASPASSSASVASSSAPTDAPPPPEPTTLRDDRTTSSSSPSPRHRLPSRRRPPTPRASPTTSPSSSSTTRPSTASAPSAACSGVRPPPEPTTGSTRSSRPSRPPNPFSSRCTRPTSSLSSALTRTWIPEAAS
uniref:histidine kinase n=1 Tax=Chrysocystis fragilis TaxID=1411660 RepID=A0A6T5UF94_9STRA